MTEPNTDNLMQNQLAWDVLAMCDMSLPRFLQTAITAEQRETKVLTIGGEKSKSPRLAIVPIRGVLSKEGWDYGASSAAIGETVLKLAKSGQVDGIMQFIDSPGGSTAGVFDAIGAIREAAAIVPVHSFIEDLGASGGFAFASAASRISASAPSWIGSIGTYSVVRDVSQMLTQMGIKTHVVGAGEFKGMLTSGTEVTEKQLAEIQRIVTQINEMFLTSVSTGRKMTMESVRAIADGRVHMAADALKFGLIDAVSSFDAAMSQLSVAAAGRSVSTPSLGRAASFSGKVQAMDETNTAPKAATLTELKAALLNSTADFREAQLEANATLAQAKQAWEVAQRDAEIATLKAERDAALTAKAEADKKAATQATATTPTKKPGVSGLGTEGTSQHASGDAVTEWNAAIKAEMDAGRDKVAATRHVIRSNPQLHESYIAAVNDGRHARPFQPA